MRRECLAEGKPAKSPVKHALATAHPFTPSTFLVSLNLAKLWVVLPNHPREGSNSEAAIRSHGSCIELSQLLERAKLVHTVHISVSFHVRWRPCVLQQGNNPLLGHLKVGRKLAGSP